MRNLKIASVVAATIAAAAASSAFAYTGENAQQTAAAAVPASNIFHMGGSSAAATSITKGIAADMCTGGTIQTFQTVPNKQPAGFNPAVPATNIGTPDLRAYYCVAAKPAGLAGQGIVIEYRADGGSIVGTYGALNSVSINELDLTKAWCVADGSNTFDCATSNNTPTVAQPSGTQLVIGTTQANGTHDSYSGAVVKLALEYGVSDEEPMIYGNGKGSTPWAGAGNEDGNSSVAPAPYPYTFLGSDSNAAAIQTAFAGKHTLFAQQIFGFVASTNLGITSISSADVNNILNGNVTDWGEIHNPATGAPVAALGTPIVVCHRDMGSGTRTGADVLFTEDGCNPYGDSSNHLVDLAPGSDNFSTPDELLCVNSQSNAFGYVSIDNFSKVEPASGTYSGVEALSLDGQAPSNILAANGSYKYVVESSIQKALGVTLSSNAGAFYGYLIPALQALGTVAQSTSINALPLTPNSATADGAALQKNGIAYVAQYMHDPNGVGNTCNTLKFVSP